MRPFFAAAAGLSLAALLGCSSSPPLETFSGAKSATFSAYCTGLLSRGTPAMDLKSGQGWVADGSLQIPGGTTVLLSYELTGQLDAAWMAYALEDDGTPHKLDTAGLVDGQDFTSDCAPDGSVDAGSLDAVVLADTTFYPQASSDGFLSGNACTVPAGTKLSSLTSPAGSTVGSAVELDSPSLRAECGTSTMYASAVALGELVSRGPSSGT